MRRRRDDIREVRFGEAFTSDELREGRVRLVKPDPAPEPATEMSEPWARRPPDRDPGTERLARDLAAPAPRRWWQFWRWFS